MAEVNSPRTCRSSSASPPPKCAICLGTCTNKCYSNSCMHQFCFTCLLEWSKVKAECPLCKQGFKSIIHNIKSNSEYDEHIITRQEHSLDDQNVHNPFLFIPPAPPRHFQFRTTFTVDPGGELAIQQMLLSHPLTNNYYVPGTYSRRASSATSFRRAIYAQNLWVYAPPDITGQYRNISPRFFRENPAARNRLVPWLNRELNALLHENTQQVMHLVDVIMEHLLHHHIRSRQFRNILIEYLHDKTDHFMHEFYNFMRSPFDMIGFDRHVIYTERPESPTLSVSDDDSSDSDVAIVNDTQPVIIENNPFRRPTVIEVIEINSDTSRDSDVIVREPSPSEVVNLVDSDSSSGDMQLTGNDLVGRQLEKIKRSPSSDSSDFTNDKEPVLPLKLRMKRKRQRRERNSFSESLKKKRRRGSSSSSSCSRSSTSSSYRSSSSSSRNSSCSSSSYKTTKNKKKAKCKIYKERVKTRKVKVQEQSRSKKPVALPDTTEVRKRNGKRDDVSCQSFRPKVGKEKKGRKKHQKQDKSVQKTDVPQKDDTSTYCNSLISSEKVPVIETSSPSYTPPLEQRDFGNVLTQNSIINHYNPPPDSSYYTSSYKTFDKFNSVEQNHESTQQLLSSHEDDINQDLFKPTSDKTKAEEVTEPSCSNPGPSRGRLRSVIIKKENSNFWYSRPFNYDSDSN